MYVQEEDTMRRKDRAAAAAVAASGSDDLEEACLTAKLLDQVDQGNMGSVSALLDAGANVDGCNDPDHADLEHASMLPLVSAAMGGNVEAVDLLIRRGADVNARGCIYTVVMGGDFKPKTLAIEGTRPLHAAVAGESLDIVHSLLRNGADPNIRDSEGYTPLLRAASRATMENDKRTVEIARELIKAGASVRVVNKDGSCPLLLAAFEGNVPMVRELLEAGGDCSVANKVGAYALVGAANLGNTELARLLLSAAPTTLNRTYQSHTGPRDYGTALYAAAGYGHEDMVEFFLSAGAKQPTLSGEKRVLCPLGAAVHFDHPGTVAVLLRKKGLEAVGGVSCILEAMQTAVARKRVKILRMLLAVEGEDREQHWARSSSRGRTILHCAASAHGNLATMSVLLAAGADETAKTAKGLSTYDFIVPCSCCGGERDLEDEAAKCRMLDRGPAFRARSWAWPGTAVSKDTASAGPAGGGIPAARPCATPTISSWVGVRIYRPESRKKHRNVWYERLVLPGEHNND